MKTPDYDVYSYMKYEYPEASHNLREGSLNCFIRAYSKELGYYGPNDRISAPLFFKILRCKSDDELLSIRNMGKNKVQFLRMALKHYYWEEDLEDNKNSQKKYKTKFNTIIDDWVRVKNHCRTTDNKDFTEKEPTEEFKRKLLISEHSPIRLIEIDWSWEDIYSWVATHWSRHKFEKFISTQRDDRKEHDIPRGEMPQNTPVKFDGYANMQSLIDSFRKRLCYQASPETRELAEDFKMALMETKPELGEVLIPNCVYRCSCPEFKACGYFNRYLLYVEKWLEDEELSSRSNTGFYRDIYIALTDIQTRYSLYNKMFKEEYKHES